MHTSKRNILPDIFWAEIAPPEHIVQIYENDTVFLDALEGFVEGGLRGNERVILIATPTHYNGLHKRLLAKGIDPEGKQYQLHCKEFNAEETVSKFIVDGWPDEKLFEETISSILEEERKSHTGHIRAFGEMVALLWAQGHCGATVHLEHLWHKFCEDKKLSLFCAYPRVGFTQDSGVSLQAICEAHSKIYGDFDPKQFSFAN